MMSAGAVACRGTMPMSGAKNMNGKNSAPQTTATQPGAATGSDSRSRLDVRRRRGGGRRAAGHRRDGVDEKGLADLGELTVLRQVARLLPHPDKGPHRVEEVGEEEGEDPRQRRHNPERRERVEADVADQAEVRTVDDVAGPASDPGCREQSRLNSSHVEI